VVYLLVVLLYGPWFGVRCWFVLARVRLWVDLFKYFFCGCFCQVFWLRVFFLGPDCSLLAGLFFVGAWGCCCFGGVGVCWVFGFASGWVGWVMLCGVGGVGVGVRSEVFLGVMWLVGSVFSAVL
jgi:hypothetical protein